METCTESLGIMEEERPYDRNGLGQYRILFDSFFHFKEAPFSNVPDPDFFYMSQQHRDVLLNMLFGIKERRGFIVIAGEIGAGKSTLCRKLLQELPAEIKSAVILNPNLSRTHLLATIIRDLGIECRGKSQKDYFEALNRFLLDGIAHGQNICLIIDEAQALSPKVLEEIRLLSNLETSKQKLIQIVLVGQPELKDLLMHPSLTQLRQRIGIFCHLQGLDRHETRQYVRHRIHQVSEEGNEVIFWDEVLDEIFEKTQGIPRLINALCDRILMAAYSRQTWEINPEIARVAFEEMEFVCA